MPAPLQPGDRVRAGDRVYHSDAPHFHGTVTRVQTHTNQPPLTALRATVEWDNGETSIHSAHRLHRIQPDTP